MEGNTKLDEHNFPNSRGSNRATADSLSGEEDITYAVDKLNTAFFAVRDTFKAEIESLKKRSIIFLSIAVGLIILVFIFYSLIICDYLKPNFESVNDIEIAFDIGVRITIISLVITLIYYCLRMLKIYLSLYEKARHKYAIIASLPILVNGSGDSELYRTTYSKIVEMMIEVGKDTSKEKEEEIKLNSLLDIIKK